MRPDSRERLSVLFKPNEIAELSEFVDQDGGFSFAGEQALVNLFLDLQQYKQFDEIMALCEIEWAIGWAKQDPGVRGNPGAKGGIGAQNRVAIESLYNSCHISSPIPGVMLRILSTPFFVITTRNEIYQFGPADKDGWREVNRSGDPLPFQICRIEVLEGEKPMELEYREGFTYMWHSAVVVNAKPFCAAP